MHGLMDDPPREAEKSTCSNYEEEVSALSAESEEGVEKFALLLSVSVMDVQGGDRLSPQRSEEKNWEAAEGATLTDWLAN